MTANKIISIVIVSFVGVAALGLYYDVELLVILGHIFTLPMVGVWYGIKRRWNTAPIDKLMYLTYFVGSFSDSLLLVGGEIGETLQAILTLIMHTILIMAFRKEGTRIYSDKAKDLPKLLIPVTIIFIFFGAVLMHTLPNVIYFIGIFYAVQEMILICHGLFREIKGRSYVWVAIGTSLIFVKDVLYSLNFYVFPNKFLSLYIIQYSLSVLVYFMIAVGMALGQKKNDGEVKETLWQYLKNRFEMLFKFNNHAIPQKTQKRYFDFSKNNTNSDKLLT